MSATASNSNVTVGDSARRGITASGVGARLRQARQARNWSVRDLARQAGVSPSLVTHIEKGRTFPSVSTLYSIVTELGLTLDELFKAARGTGGGRLANAVQYGRRRTRIQLAGGVHWERLTPAPGKDCEFLFVVYAPGGESCPPGSTARHCGKEFAYLVRGRLGITIGAQQFALVAGDSIAFDGRIPHRLWAIGKTPAEAVWLVRNGGTRDRILPSSKNLVTFAVHAK